MPAPDIHSRANGSKQRERVRLSSPVAKKCLPRFGLGILPSSQSRDPAVFPK